MPSEPPLLDTNTILRHVLQDHQDHSPRSSALFARLESQALTVRILDQALFEVAFTMARTYKATREQIRDAIVPLVEMPSVMVRNRDAWLDTFEVFLMHTRLSLVDSFHVAMARRLGVSEIISFDKGFDGIPGLTRIEP